MSNRSKGLMMTDASRRTGFGTCSHYICNALAEEYDQYLLGWGYRGDEVIPRGKYHILPCGNHPFGADVLPQVIQQLHPEFLLVQADERMIEWMNRQILGSTVWINYIVIDGYVFDLENSRKKWVPKWTDFMKQADKTVAMSRFGKGVLEANGIAAEYVPHGVDLGAYRQYTPEQKKELKARNGLEDKFVVLGVSKNITRKQFDKFLQIFTIFRRGKEDKVAALLHTIPNPQMGGEMDLPEHCRAYNLQVGKDVFFSQIGIPPEAMPNIYNMGDVFLQAGWGEGWGMTLTEALACGTVALVTNSTTAPEILDNGKCGELIDVVKYSDKKREVTFGSFCVKPETILLGDNKSISSVIPTDNVVGINGLTKVKETFNRNYRGEMIKIKAMGLLPIEVTPEHPIMTIEKKYSHYKKFYRDPKWVEAKNIKKGKACGWKQSLLIPRIKGNISIKSFPLEKYRTIHGRIRKDRKIFPLDEDTAWLLGVYVAEGSQAINGVSFALGSHETAFIERLREVIRKLNFSPSTVIRGSSTVIILPSVILARAFIEWCGKGAENKKMPDFILYHSDERILKAFIAGHLQGDGCIHKKLGYTRHATVSIILVQQLQLAYARLGKLLSIFVNPPHISVMRGKFINCRTLYNTATHECSSNQKHGVTENYISVPITSVEKTFYNGNVYNIRTEDNTYLVSNAVIHNCGVEFCIPDIYDGAEKLNRLYNNPTLMDEYRLKGCVKVAEEYDWGKIGVKWREIVKKAITGDLPIEWQALLKEGK